MMQQYTIELMRKCKKNCVYNFPIARTQSTHSVCNLRFVRDGKGHRTRTRETREENDSRHAILHRRDAPLLFPSCFLVRVASRVELATQILISGCRKEIRGIQATDDRARRTMVTKIFTLQK